MSWTLMTFGKHEGKTLPQAVLTDPDWFFWAIEKSDFDWQSQQLKAEAEDINHKARNIKIPQKEGQEELVAEYAIHRPTGKFGLMELVPSSRPEHRGSSPTFRRPVIDLHVPREIAPYDKLGCKTLIRSVKRYLFEGANVRMTKARAEEFFDNEANFN